MSIYRRGDVWWLYIVPPHGGKRYRRSTGERDRARAQRIHDELKAELWKRRSGRSLHAALDTWAEGKDKRDVNRVKILKKKIKDVELDSLDPKKVGAALPQKAGTFNRYVNILHAAGVRGLVRKKAPDGRIRWLTAPEWEALRKNLHEKQRPMAELAIATGIRQANVFRLEWRQVDLKRRLAWIHPDQAKSRKPISVPLNDDAMRVLEARLEAQESKKWVFIGKDGKKPPVEIKTAWKTALKKAKLSDFTWHDLRHTWATWHVMNGTPLEVLQKLGGWADLRMVMRYAHLAESYVAQYAANSKPYDPSHTLGHTEQASA